MNKEELIELLSNIATKDLMGGHSLENHPCSVACKALNQCFEDIEKLQSYCESYPPASHKASKAKVLLTSTAYTPQW